MKIQRFEDSKIQEFKNSRIEELRLWVKDWKRSVSKAKRCTDTILNLKTLRCVEQQ